MHFSIRLIHIFKSMLVAQEFLCHVADVYTFKLVLELFLAIKFLGQRFRHVINSFQGISLLVALFIVGRNNVSIGYFF